MSDVVLNEAFLAKIAGWDAMKKARALLQQGAVFSSNWTPPLLKGVVQEGSVSYRAGLVIKDTINLENMCRCRPSQDWGTICAHSVAVGLHHLQRVSGNTPPPAAGTESAKPLAQPQPVPSPLRKPGNRLQRTGAEGEGEAAELSVILPPNFGVAVARGKVMVCFEAKWSRGRTPLNSLPLNVPFRFTAQDAALLDRIEELAEGETPGMLLLTSDALTGLFRALLGHPRVSLGRGQSISIEKTPWRVPLKATLQDSGQILVQLRPIPDQPVVISGTPSWVFHRNTLQPIQLPGIGGAVWRGPIRLERSQVPAFLGDWATLNSACDLEANFQLEDFVLEPQAPRFLFGLLHG